MKSLRIGTRGSDLALWQARHIAERLRQATGVSVDIKIIQTEADLKPEMPLTPEDWPTGGFTTALEEALLAGSIDLAVHSLKDLPTQSPHDLVIASIPERGPVHDVILARSAEIADALRLALDKGKLPSQPVNIGSSSPRRAWQAERFLGCTAVPIRGNVPTRIAKLIAGQYDAICLAAAGLHRLNLQHDYQINLPIDRFPTAPGQGALAVQTHRAAEWISLLQAIDHQPTRQCVQAERTFLHVMKAGCHAPLAASAVLQDNQIRLHVQMRLGNKTSFEQIAYGADPEQLGQQLAEQALQAERQP